MQQQRYAINYAAYDDLDSNHYFKGCVEIYHKLHKLISSLLLILLLNYMQRSVPYCVDNIKSGLVCVY